MVVTKVENRVCKLFTFMWWK